MHPTATFTRFTSRPSVFSVQRARIPTVITPQRHFKSFVDKVLYALTGMKRLNPEETQQAIIKHQKLWVAHASINNHEEAHAHYELFYAMQLFREPKDFETQRYYLQLTEKRKEELSLQELNALIALYELAIDELNSVDLDALVLYPFVLEALQKKLHEYQSYKRMRE